MAKKSKYGNVKCRMHGIVFDSKGEMLRYMFLRDQQYFNKISDLKHHVDFSIEVKGVVICDYEADFTYLKDGVLVVEDFKGVETAVFKLKKKLLKAALGIDIRVVKIATEDV